jgi:hypothetical protein
VLDGEHLGLLPVDDGGFTIYFANFPIAYFDSRTRRMLPLSKHNPFYRAEAMEGEDVPLHLHPSLNHPKSVSDVPV